MEFWFCTESALAQHETFLKTEGMNLKGVEAKVKVAGHSFELPPIYERKGSVGLINIKGLLTPGEASIYRLFGMTGYTDIENAVVEALQDKEAKSIMLNVSSPGGNAKGLKETSDLIRTMTQVKPTSAYANLAHSAAYWLTVNARHITLSEMGEAGSIGVVTSITNYAKSNEDEGIETRVYRSGKYKALGHPSERFTPELDAEMQSKVDQLGGMFTAHVARSLGTTPEIVNDRMGQGREYIGVKARDVGLVHAIGTVEDALQYAANNRSLLTA